MKALLVGINYFGSEIELSGCIQDVERTYNWLMKKYKCRDENILILTDDLDDEKQIPTHANILKAFNWLIDGAEPGDSLFFHFSGHGGSVEDENGDEVDGRDETIMPVDFATAGHIVDDQIYDVLVKPLPRGVQLTVLFDSCHSGTAMDLPFSYAPRRFPYRSRFIRRITEINTFRNAIRKNLEKGLVDEKDLPDGLRLSDFDLKPEDVRPERPPSVASSVSAASEADGEVYREWRGRTIPLPSPSLEVDIDPFRGRKSLPNIAVNGSIGRLTADTDNLTINPLVTGNVARSLSRTRASAYRHKTKKQVNVLDTIQTKLWPGCNDGVSKGLVIQFASCRDFETAADAEISGKGQLGAMTWAFVTAMDRLHRPSVGQLLFHIRDLLAENYTQKPQMSASCRVDLDMPFSL
ncbi:peptidase C14 [Gonapodya prolifera JEL478]|uniref:Peptidase C14 n=1 Tax=Gonapodya prolifera (strain JEL478) TaxID=1344416 RepID=A0A139A4R5_GONPJ|nr:peptidase C14 [Gonapodya prolifera JEL478]|eukprot:KXS11373.1 peptidase C14 [Gonapodya prolifera JEL478]